MSFAHFVAILLAGAGAGTINTVVGSGSLITFPTLVALGYPPIDRQCVEQHRPGPRLGQRRVRLPQGVAGPTAASALDDALQRLNACKNVLAGSVNAAASVVFILSTDVDWKGLPPKVLRAVIVVVGLTALVRLL